VFPFIWPRQPVSRLFRYQRAGIRIGPGIEPDVAAAGDKGSIGHHPGFDIQNGGMLALGQEVLFHGHAEPHRTPRQFRQQYCDGFGLAVVLRAVASPDIGHLHADHVFRMVENPGQFLAQRKRVLATGPDVYRFSLHARDGDEGFQMKVLIPRKEKTVFENVIAPLEGPRIASFVGEPVAIVDAQPAGTAGALSVGRHNPHRFFFE